jgi:hypothetical protein
VRSDAAHAASSGGRTCQRVLGRKLWKTEETAILVEISSPSKVSKRLGIRSRCAGWHACNKLGVSLYKWLGGQPRPLMTY